MILRRTFVAVSVTAAALVGILAAPERADAVERWRSPARGAVIGSPPILRWRDVRDALFYNVQLYRNDRKILTRWPREPRFRVRSRWSNSGRTYRLRPGLYRWYVWPAYARGYGRLRVRSSFTFGRRPASAAPPVIVGDDREGELLSARTGVWRGYPRPRISYAWRRCDPDGTCAPIPAARARLYDVTAADIDAALQVVVTASNPLGSAHAVSARVGPIVPAPPSSTSSPWMIGGRQIGALAVAVTGTWTSSRPVDYSFRWLRCNGGECSAIPRATRQSYAIRPRDFLRRLRVVVTGTNGGGSTSATSPASERVGRTIVGTQARDHVRGSPGSDFVRVFASDDAARAGRGADRLHGGRGHDRLYGGAGDDRLVGGAGRDILDGGSGNDLVAARDRRHDFVTCGGGVDRVRADRDDRVSSTCELVARR